MALIPNEVKAALACLKSIDKSLGRIAEALEKQQGEKDVRNLSNSEVRKTTSNDKGINS